MRPITTLLLLALALSFGLPTESHAQVVQGTCSLGSSSQDLNINNVRARLYNKGNLFFNGGDPHYEVPTGGGVAAVFAGSIWVSGTVNGQVRAAAATYAQFGQDYEFYPGPLNEDGSLPNPSDCSQFDRMYKVSRTDITAVYAGEAPTPDLAEWPVGLGAPACIDENEDARCSPDEPRVEATSRDQLINLANGEIPDVIGDQGIWWVMNDVGGPHLSTLTPPIGIETRVLAFAFARADALNDATFYKHEFIYRGTEPFEDVHLTIFSDPDLGAYDDDYIGSDPELGLGFVYNSGDPDGEYGAAPPALGYDFFRGPIVEGPDGSPDTLSMTKFGYFNNNPDPRTGNPNVTSDYFNYSRGLWKDGTPWTEGGQATGEGDPVDFVYPNSGSPESPTPGYWSEVCPDPNCTAPVQPDDRRFIMSTGPFTMMPGDKQEVIYGIVWARGSSNFGSLQEMKRADQLAQLLFDADFQVAPPPPAPNVEAVELSGEAAIVWSYPEGGDPRVTNYLGQYSQEDPLIAGIPGYDSYTYDFEGFNVYRYPNATMDDTERELIATYDKVNGVTTIIDEAFDAELGDVLPFIAARGTDSGVQFHHVIRDQLVNYQTYYFGVTAYAYNEESSPKVQESAASKIEVRPADVLAASGGTLVNSNIGEGLVGALVPETSGNAIVSAFVVDPTQVTGATYLLDIEEIVSGDSTAFTFRIVNETTGETVFDGVQLFEERGLIVEPGGSPVIADGISFFLVTEPEIPELDADGAPDFAGDGDGIVEIAHPSGAVCEAGSTDPGCLTYGGNTVWLDENSTSDYVVTEPANNRTALLQADIATPEDYELRFTEECATMGNCLGAYLRDGGQILSVPFEIWNIGSPQDPNDDVRMIPMVRPTTGTDPVTDWADAFPSTQNVIVGRGAAADTTDLPVTHRVYWMMPDRPEGYELFAEAARGFGGPGAVYDRDNDGDTQIDTTSSGGDCSQQGAFIDFCYRSIPPYRAPIGGAASSGMVLADLSGDGTTPEVGTVVRFQTVPKPLFYSTSQYRFDSSALAVETGNEAAADSALARIGVVPNPYRGMSRYETGSTDRRVRFINLPDQATIRIFTVSGTLIRTLQANNTRDLDWNLETENGVPVASGMYLIHVETPAGDTVLKLGVVNREARFDVF